MSIDESVVVDTSEGRWVCCVGNIFDLTTGSFYIIRKFDEINCSSRIIGED